MSNTPWLTIAKGELGQKEIPGDRHNPRILEWGEVADVGWKVTTDEVANCATFANFCLVKAGYPSTHSALARSFMNYGTRLAKPVRGAIVVFPRGKNPTYGHVAFVLQVNADGTIRCINANVSDMVRESTFKISSILPGGCRWPPGAPMDMSTAQISDIGSDDSPTRDLLRVGDRGNDVEDMQRDLDTLGYMENDPNVRVFGAETERALKRFQIDQNLVVDGIYGPASMAAMATAVREKAKTKQAEKTADVAAKPVAIGAGGLGIAGVTAGTVLDASDRAAGWSFEYLVFVVLLVAAGVGGYFLYRYGLSRAKREAGE